MKGFLAVYRKFLMGLTRVVGIIAGLLLFIPAFSVVYEVSMRGMFNSPTEWVVEISTYCVTIAGFLGMAVTFVANKHIKVDILLSHLSKRTNEILKVITSFIGMVFCGMVFCGIVTIYSIGMVAMTLEHGMIAPTTLRTPLWIPQSSLPIGFGLMFLHFIRTFLENLIMLGDPEYDPAAAAGEVAK